MSQAVFPPFFVGVTSSQAPSRLKHLNWKEMVQLLLDASADVGGQREVWEIIK